MNKFLLLLFPVCAMIGCSQPSSDRKEKGKTEDGSPKVEEYIELNEEKKQWPLDFLMGKFDPEEHEDFIEIPEKYASRAGMFLKKEVFDAYLKMFEAAQKEGIDLVIRSATRNFDAQKRIWEEKWRGERPSAGKNARETYPDPVDRALNILLYSSMPGTSRHHWGTDIDLNSFDNYWFEHGEGLKLFLWLKENGPNFGFCRPYTALNEDRPTGYQEEKWHWSYYPLSSKLTKQAEEKLSDDMISGFLGHETATIIEVVKNYVLGIHPSCLQNQHSKRSHEQH